MAYPLSSEVTPGQPTASSQYNNLRRDAVRLGQADLDSLDLSTYLKGYTSGIVPVVLSTTRVRVPYNASNPPRIMINGCMLCAVTHTDLAPGLISGPAATWYIFAVRTPGSPYFSLAVNTSPVEGVDQRLIGHLNWTGTAILSTVNYLSSGVDLPAAQYDSGWFAVAVGSTFTKAHGLGMSPSIVLLYHSTDAAGTSEAVLVTSILSAAGVIKNVVGITPSSILADAGITAGLSGTCYSTRRESGSGYWRILAWR